jgi:hypothetical protein
VSRSKHVEPSINFGIIISITRLHPVWLFLLIHTTMHGSMNIKRVCANVVFSGVERRPYSRVEATIPNTQALRLSRNTNKMRLVIKFTIPKFIEDSTCFERHTAHYQEL